MTTQKELATEIKYISKSIDEMKALMQQSYDEAKKTNGRVTKLETEMEAVKKLEPEVEEQGRDIARIKVVSPMLMVVFSAGVAYLFKRF